ncbi:hypothetical protein HMPREF0262_01646 [Clostridium sp. ATCC 29733]|nr:hypothetical protein HMPREF0262_01646 [Clostridium sp. ATCC 29733]
MRGRPKKGALSLFYPPKRAWHWPHNCVILNLYTPGGGGGPL